MVRLINQFSFLIITIPLLAFLLFLLLRGEGARLKQVLAILLLAAVVIGFLLIRPGRGALTTEQNLTALEASETPVLVEVYSNYWLACIRAKPIVDGLEEELAGSLLVLQLNIHDEDLRDEINRLNIRFTPTFILLDREGTEQWRQEGLLDVDEIRRQLASIS
jgi:thiol-disulfide isomerase/thioredoxin